MSQLGVKYRQHGKLAELDYNYTKTKCCDIAK